MQQGNYSLPALLAALEAGSSIKYLWFWGHQPSKDGTITASCFSQWWESALTVEGETFATAEHWMMAGKARLFEDEAKRQQILKARTPGEAKRLGREISGFDQQVWEAERFALVCEGNWHKFSQDPALKTYLLSTQSRVLVEASPVDPIWGIGLAKDDPNAAVPVNWQGLNLLGFALMEVRDRIAAGQ